MSFWVLTMKRTTFDPTLILDMVLIPMIIGGGSHWLPLHVGSYHTFFCRPILACNSVAITYNQIHYIGTLENRRIGTSGSGSASATCISRVFSTSRHSASRPHAKQSKQKREPDGEVQAGVYLPRSSLPTNTNCDTAHLNSTNCPQAHTTLHQHMVDSCTRSTRLPAPATVLLLRGER